MAMDLLSHSTELQWAMVDRSLPFQLRQAFGQTPSPIPTTPSTAAHQPPIAPPQAPQPVSTEPALEFPSFWRVVGKSAFAVFAPFLVIPVVPVMFAALLAMLPVPRPMFPSAVSSVLA